MYQISRKTEYQDQKFRIINNKKSRPPKKCPKFQTNLMIIKVTSKQHTITQ